MIKTTDLLSLPFYERSAFTGSCGKLCYKILKTTEEDKKQLRAFCWEGPFASDKVEDSKKQSFCTDFSEDGLKQITDWLNQSAKELTPTNINL